MLRLGKAIDRVRYSEATRSATFASTAGSCPSGLCLHCAPDDDFS